MAKHRAKARNQSSTPEIDSPTVRNRSTVSILDEADAVAQDPQQIRRPPYHDTTGSHPMMMESYDSTHSPFFLHSADHPCLSIVAHTLDGTNYNSWSIAMRISLDAKNKLGFVDGSLARPAIDDRLYKIWSRCNSMVKSWLLNVVNKEIYDSILYYEDAAEMWDDLFRRFKVNNLPRKYQLEQAVISLKQGNSDLSTYFTKKKTLWEQLANTRSPLIKKCDCEQVKELLEEAEMSRIIQFLIGLNENFNNFRGQILNMKPRPGLNDIYNILDQDESHRLVGTETKRVVHPAAFQMQTPTSDNNQILLAHGNYQKPKCTHCHRIDHTMDKCYRVHSFPPGHPQRGKNNKYAGPSNATASQVSVRDSSSKKNDDSMYKEQIQHMIAYLSTKLQVSGSISERNNISTPAPSSYI